MQRELAAANNTIRGLSKEIECLHEGNNNAREMIDLLQSQVTAYEETIRRMEAEIQRLQHDLVEAQRAKEAAEKKLELERQAMQAQIDALSARLESSPATTTAEVIVTSRPTTAAKKGQRNMSEGLQILLGLGCLSPWPC